MINSDEALVEALSEAIDNVQNAPIKIPININVEALQDLQSMYDIDAKSHMIDGIMEILRPQGLDRVEQEIRRHNIPDGLLKSGNIKKIAIERYVSEADFVPRTNLLVYLDYNS